MNLNIIEPNYFKHFHCIGGECKQNCCSCNWNIPFDKKDYFSIKKLKKSKELNELCMHAFRRIKNADNSRFYAQMRMNENGSCYFLDDNGFCMFQKECGHNALPDVCKIFPRQYFMYLNSAEQYLSTGCEEVVRLLMELTNGIELTNGTNIGDNRKINVTLAIQTPEEANTVPYKYYWDVKTLIISIAKNRNYSIEDRLILLGIAFKHIDELIDANAGDRIPAYIDGLISACVDDKSMLEGIKDIEPLIYQNAINFANMLSVISGLKVMPQNFSSKLLEAYGITYQESNKIGKVVIEVNNAKIEKQLGYLFNMISGREYIIENFMLNSMLYLNLPFTDTNMSFWDSYIFICQVYSLMIFMLAGNLTETSDDNDIIEAFVIFSRCLFHNKYLRDFLIDFIKNNNSTTLASMVYLIKF